MAKRGRPEKLVDMELVRKCAEVGCTDEEIADITGVCPATFRSRKHREEFLAVLIKARAELKRSIRRAQVVAALGGNVTAQIWLGKQMLGQRDKHDFEITDEVLLERLRQIKAEAEARAKKEEDQ